MGIETPLIQSPTCLEPGLEEIRRRVRYTNRFIFHTQTSTWENQLAKSLVTENHEISTTIKSCNVWKSLDKMPDSKGCFLGPLWYSFILVGSPRSGYTPKGCHGHPRTALCAARRWGALSQPCGCRPPGRLETLDTWIWWSGKHPCLILKAGHCSWFVSPSWLTSWFGWTSGPKAFFKSGSPKSTGSSFTPSDASLRGYCWRWLTR